MTDHLPLLERFPKSGNRFLDKKRGKNKELESFVEPSETKTALEQFPKDMRNAVSKDRLPAHKGLSGQQGKRALRRQRARDKKRRDPPSDSCLEQLAKNRTGFSENALEATARLRGMRKISPSRLCADKQQQHVKPHVTEHALSRPNGGRRHFVSPEAEIYAALDLGTNNCRLLIATPSGRGRFRTLDRFSRIVRLGEGIGACNALSREAMNRAMEALDMCRAKLSQWPVRHQRLIATEACRLAQNGAEFLNQVRCQLGLELEIVSRETEARLAVAGCSSLIERETESLVLFDIGGGSSEIALIDISGRRSKCLSEHIIAWTSLPVGVVTLAERFGGKNVSATDFSRMKAYVKNMLDQFDGRDKLGNLARRPSFHLLGTSGTMTTLAGIHLKLERYDRRRVDGVWMCGEEVTRMTQRLLSWNMEQRMANPCIGAERADLVLAGCAILEAIRSCWPCQRLRVADRGLREGILMELMLKHF